MKSIFLFLFCVGIVTSIHAQQDQRKFSLGYVQTFDRSYRTIISTDASQNFLKQALDTIETGIFTSNVSLIFGYELSNKLTFHSGISYAERGQQLKASAMLNYNKYTTLYEFLEVPLLVTFRHERNKNTLSYGLGFNATYLFKSKILYKDLNDLSNTVIINSSSFKNPGLSLRLQSSYLFQLDEKNEIEMGLHYDQQIFSVGRGTLKRLPFSAGILFGFHHSI